MRPTKKAMAQYQARWRRVRRFEIEETRRTSYTTKYRQFLQLVAWVRAFGWSDYLAKDDDIVRQRWRRLRKMYRGQEKKQ